MESVAVGLKLHMCFSQGLNLFSALVADCGWLHWNGPFVEVTGSKCDLLGFDRQLLRAFLTDEELLSFSHLPPSPDLLQKVAVCIVFAYECKRTAALGGMLAPGLLGDVLLRLCPYGHQQLLDTACNSVMGTTRMGVWLIFQRLACKLCLPNKCG